MYTLRLGKSVKALCGDYYEIIQEMAKLGYHSIDIVLCECGFENTAEQVEEVKKRIIAAKNLGLYFNNIHLPYGYAWDISILDDEKRRLSMDNVKSIISWGDMLQPYCYVFHPSAGPIFDKDRPQRLVNLEKSMKELQAFTKTPLAVENMPDRGMLNTGAELQYFAKKMGNVQYCIDVNHFLRELPEEALELIGKYAITLHISDHDYTRERHWLPAKGKIDWQKVIAALEKANYQGVWNYEVLEGTLAEIKYNYLGLFAEYNNCIEK